MSFHSSPFPVKCIVRSSSKRGLAVGGRQATLIARADDGGTRWLKEALGSAEDSLAR